MSLEAKKDCLVKLFLGFPSASKMDRDLATSITASYLEILQPFSSDVLLTACDAFRRRPSAFPPSSGELYAECDRIVAARKREAEWKGPAVPKRLAPPPRRGFSVAELSDFGAVINGVDGPYTMRVDENGSPLIIPRGLPGEGHPTFYGYLTPTEAAAGRRRNSQNSFSEFAA